MNHDDGRTKKGPRIMVIGSLAASLRNFRGPLIEAMQARGAEVHVVAPGLDQDDEIMGWLAEIGVIGHSIAMSRTGLNPWHDLHLLADLWRLMRNTQPDRVLAYTVKPVVWGLLAARAAGVRRPVALISGLGYAFTGTARGKRALVQFIVRLLYRQSLRAASLIIFQNPDDRADMAKFGLLPKAVQTMLVNGSGVDLSHFHLSPLPDGPVRFLLVARLLRDKGIREYAEAAALLRDRYPQAEWHLVGGLDSNPESVSRVEVEDWIRRGLLHWHGHMKDVRPAIAAAHVFVLPSYREGMPRTVLEAMAMGRAVITTDAPGCRETVEPGLTGFLVAPRDARSLAGAMERFLSEPYLAAKMSRPARDRAEALYDVNKVNALMLAGMEL